MSRSEYDANEFLSVKRNSITGLDKMKHSKEQKQSFTPFYILFFVVFVCVMFWASGIVLLSGGILAY